MSKPTGKLLFAYQTIADLEVERDTLRTANQRLEALLRRVQVSLSLDDTEWGYSATEKYTLLADIKAALVGTGEQQ